MAGYSDRYFSKSGGRSSSALRAADALYKSVHGGLTEAMVNPAQQGYEAAASAVEPAYGMEKEAYKGLSDAYGTRSVQGTQLANAAMAARMNVGRASADEMLALHRKQKLDRGYSEKSMSLMGRPGGEEGDFNTRQAFAPPDPGAGAEYDPKNAPTHTFFSFVRDLLNSDAKALASVEGQAKIAQLGPLGQSEAAKNRRTFPNYNALLNQAAGAAAYDISSGRSEDPVRKEQLKSLYNDLAYTISQADYEQRDLNKRELQHYAERMNRVYGQKSPGFMQNTPMSARSSRGGVAVPVSPE